MLFPLLLALSRNPDIKHIKLAIPRNKVSPTTIALLKNANIEIFDVQLKKIGNGFRDWLESDECVFDIKGSNKFKQLIRHFLPTINYIDKDQLNSIAQDCDLIYAFWPHIQSFPDIGKPVVCTYQDATLLEFPEILGCYKVKKEFMNTEIWLKGCAQVIVSSNSTKNILSKYFGDQCLAFPVIYHAIMPTVSTNITESPDFNKYKFSSPYIVYPSNIITHKNHYNLLIAWSQFHKRKDYQLIFFGSGTEILNKDLFDLQSENFQILRLLGLIKRNQLIPGKDFIALGYIKDGEVLPLIKNAFALIMPSLAEGGGSFPVEEALNLGTPVLCSDIPVMREHLSQRSANIIWFDPNSPESILQALNELTLNYDIYKESTIRGIKDPRPSWDDIASQYATIFKNVINE